MVPLTHWYIQHIRTDMVSLEFWDIQMTWTNMALPLYWDIQRTAPTEKTCASQLDMGLGNHTFREIGQEIVHTHKCKSMVCPS